MRVAVCIPTHQRLGALARCVGALAHQTAARSQYDIIVGIDGPDTGEAAAIAAIDPDARVIACPKRGPAATRNTLIDHADAELILWLNDDVVPAPDLVAQHLSRHADLDRDAMVLGDAPFAITQPDRLFDRLIRETSMVFFYDQMNAAHGDRDPDHDSKRDWSYRHAWTLNLSMPAEPLRRLGGFTASLAAPAFEDLECAHRLANHAGMPVLYHPEARVVHEHQYEPEQYLARERSLGREAVRLARVAPGCATDLFGRDLLDPRERDAARTIVDRFSRDAARCEPRFLELATMPADAIAGPHAGQLIAMLYQQHLLLKRVRWHEGVLEALDLAQAA